MGFNKYMDLKEFVDGGFLQEANRLFFHPRGLALQMVIDDSDPDKLKYVLSGVEDYRDDPEGIYFGATEDEEINKKRKFKIDNVEKIRLDNNVKRTVIVAMEVHHILVEDIWTDNTEFLK